MRTAPAIPIRGFGDAYADLDADLVSVLVFIVRYAEVEAVSSLHRNLEGARTLTGGERRGAFEKALYDAAFFAVVSAPNEAADEVWTIVERIDPYGDPELNGLSAKGEATLEKLAEDSREGRLIEGGWGDDD
ncbi:hypothetical protein BH11ARM2_BH11ARM2_24980 [soil metagenome]